MKLGPIVLKLRLADTRFGNLIGGAAEFAEATALDATLQKDTAFVVQLAENAGTNNQSSGINQKITEIFAVIVAIANDSQQKDKLGITAFDSLHDIRTELFRAILGWQLPEADIPDIESVISYNGGQLLGINRGYLWYQFSFEVSSRITEQEGVDVGKDNLPTLKEIFAQYTLNLDGVTLGVSPKELPVNSNDDVHMEQSVQ